MKLTLMTQNSESVTLIGDMSP